MLLDFVLTVLLQLISCREILQEIWREFGGNFRTRKIQANNIQENFGAFSYEKFVQNKETSFLHPKIWDVFAEHFPEKRDE